MALKDQAINLVLRAKNLLSGDTDAAARSVEELAGSAEGLKGKLRSLEDQGKLIGQFKSAEKAVDRTRSAWERATLKVDKLKDKIKQSGEATEIQAKELRDAEKAAERAAKGYASAEDELGELGKNATEAGIDLENLNDAQRKNAKETTKAKRAIADLNNTVEKSSGKFKAFRKSLSDGVTTFAKWGAAATAAGAALTVGALTRFTSGQADLARQTLASSEAFGVSAEALQKWQYAAEEVGIGGEKVADIMKDVAEKIGDAYLTGGGEAREVIQGLGLDLEKLALMKPDEQILAISKELNGMPKAGQIQILEALASDASLLLPLLDENAKGLRELSAAAEERGVIFTDEELKKLAEVDRSFRDITSRIQGFGKEIVVRLAPAFKKMATTIDEALGDKPELVDQISEAFVSLIEKTGEFVEYVVEKRKDIGESLRGIGHSVDGVGSTFVALFRGVQAFGAGAAEVAARVAYSWNSAGLAILELRNKIGLATDEAVEKARFGLEAIGTSVTDLSAQSEAYKQQMIEAGSAALESFKKAGSVAVDAAASVASVATSAAKAAVGLEDTGEAVEKVATKLEKFQKAEADLEKQIEETALALEAAGVAFAEADTTENKAQVDTLRASYEELIGALKRLREEQALEGQNISEGGDGVDPGKANKYKTLADDIDSAGDAADSTSGKVKSMGDEVSRSGDKVEEVGKVAKETAGSVATGFTQLFSGMVDYIDRLSAKAGAAFREALGGRTTDVGSALEQRLERVNALLSYTQKRVTNGGVSETLNKWATAAYGVEQQFLEQAVAVEKLTDKILDGDRSSRYLRMSADEVARSFSLLDENQLRPLIGAIQSAQREVESLNNSLLDTIAATNQELAALRGDTAEVERLRHEERRFELQQQLNTARALGDKETIANAEKALKLTDEAYNARTKQAKERAKEAEERALEAEARAADRRIRDEKEERQDISRVEKRTQTQVTQLDRASTAPRTVRLELSGGGTSFGTINALDDGAIELLIRRLEQAGLTISGG